MPAQGKEPASAAEDGTINDEEIQGKGPAPAQISRRNSTLFVAGSDDEGTSKSDEDAEQSDGESNNDGEDSDTEAGNVLKPTRKKRRLKGRGKLHQKRAKLDLSDDDEDEKPPVVEDIKNNHIKFRKLKVSIISLHTFTLSLRF